MFFFGEKQKQVSFLQHKECKTKQTNKKTYDPNNSPFQNPTSSSTPFILPGFLAP